MNICRLHKKHWFSVIGILFISTFIISYESTTVPEWKMRVVSEDGNPLPNKLVTQRWIDRSLEWGSEHTDVLYSDQEGYVIFPKRTVTASLFTRFCGTGVRFLSILNPHASSEPYAIISSPRYGILMYREGVELKSELVVEE